MIKPQLMDVIKTEDYDGFAHNNLNSYYEVPLLEEMVLFDIQNNLEGQEFLSRTSTMISEFWKEKLD